MLLKTLAGVVGLWTLMWSVKSLEHMSHQAEFVALRDNDLETFAALRGMNFEKHNVITVDNWKLELHRIRNMQVYDPKFSTPVMLSHGFACSSVDFMLNPRNESLAFILADSGFDVWAVNYRANRFSNVKVINGVETLPNATDFYRATWQYMAERDVPAFLEKILTHTKQTQLHIIGQSMGTTTLLAFLSENHAYDDKIGHFAAITPVIKFGEDTSSYLKSLFRLARRLPVIAKGPLFPFIFGRPFLSVTRKFNYATEYSRSATCRLLPSLCRSFSDLLFQTEFKSTMESDFHLKKERTPLYFMKFPSGATMMNLYHFATQFDRNPWTKMDYRGVPSTRITNRGEYSQDVPPSYNFSAVNVSISVQFVRNDVFLGRATTESIASELNLDKSSVQVIDGHNFNHIDTVWGWDARCFLYDGIVRRLHELELARGQARRSYRTRRVKLHLKSLRFENSCQKH